jgi:hypothetical protein
MQPTKHEPCLYSGFIDNHKVLFLRQVDDFAVASTSTAPAEKLINLINDKMRIPVKHLGIIHRYNGMDIHQTKHYVKLTCETYLYKMLKNHGWLLQETSNQPIPLPSDNAYIKTLESAIPPNTIHDREHLKAKYFNYHQVIGEIIYPTMKCCPDIAVHAAKLSQYMENPAEAHYLALRQLCNYLASTINEGIYYWREQPVQDLPEGQLPRTSSDNHTLTIHPHMHTNTFFGYVDSDWATDTSHRKSISGIAMLYAGGAIGYKCKYQDTIAHSSTEAEFVAACDAGKMILFFRSLLDDLGYEQPQATTLYEDNNGALMMANAQQPTRCTRHIDIKHYSLLDWVERDLMILTSIPTSNNAADALTKPLAKQLFYRHTDTLLGRRVPLHLQRSLNPHTCSISTLNESQSSYAIEHGGG